MKFDLQFFAVTYPSMSDMVLEISLEGTTWLLVGDGVTDITPALNRETTDKYYMNMGGAKTTISTGLQRTFAVSGDLAVGDPATDAVMAHSFKFGDSDAIGVDYRYYNRTTKKGETGKANIIVSNDGGGTANERMTYEYSINASGIPSEYTHTEV